MNIAFPQQSPSFCSDTLTLRFPAIVDQRAIECSISAEALEDHFGALSVRDIDLIEAFEKHRTAIELVARRLIDELEGRPALLRSGYFRYLAGGA